MSVKVMGAVFDCDLPRDEKYILLSYADHAAHDGTSIYPAVARMAWKTGYSTRSVQAITRKLEKSGILVPDGSGPNGVNRWRIALDKLPVRGDYQTGANSTGCKKQQEGVQETAPGGAKFAPNPSLTVTEPSHGADAPPTIAPPQEPVGEELITEYFGPPPERLLATKTPHYTQQMAEPWARWGGESEEMQRQLNRYGERGRTVQRLGYELERLFGMRPLWSDKAAVKSWMSGISTDLQEAEGNEKLITQAAQELRDAGLEIATPYSLRKKIASLAAKVRSPGGNNGKPVPYTDEWYKARMEADPQYNAFAKEAE